MNRSSSGLSAKPVTNSSRTQKQEGKEKDQERSNNAPRQSGDSVSCEKKDFEEEWFFLQQLYMQWKENDPEKHALYDKAINLVAPDKSLQYYQGVYHTLVTLHPIIDLVLNPQSEFKDDPQGAMTNILQLQLGHVVKLILERWPEHLIPKITDSGKPKASRSRMERK